MFVHKQTTLASASGGQPAAPKSEAAVADFVIYSMPKEFRDRPINVYPQDKQPQVPTVAPIPKPAAPPPTTSLSAATAGAPPKPRPGVLLPMNRGPVVVKPRIQTPPPKKSKRNLILVIIAMVLVVGAGVVAMGYVLGWFAKPVPVVDAPVETPAPEPVVTPLPEAPKITNGADTDSDGLTNVEELMYGTDFRNPDSDGDTYLDGNEIFHRYNPVALAPSTLLDTGAVRVLDNSDLPFSMSYPTSWNPVSQPAAMKAGFRSDSGAVVSVVWQVKEDTQTLSDWYLSQVGEADLDRLQATTTKEGYSALIGPDERVMYLEADGRVYTLMYDLGESVSVEFLQTFKMMANSFALSY